MKHVFSFITLMVLAASIATAQPGSKFVLHEKVPNAKYPTPYVVNNIPQDGPLKGNEKRKPEMKYITLNADGTPQANETSAERFIVKLKDQNISAAFVSGSIQQKHLARKAQHRQFLSDLNRIQNTLAATRSSSKPSRVLREYTRTFNGFAMEGDEELKKAIRKLGYVASVIADQKVKAIDLSSSQLINADDVWAQYNATGKDITIGIIDTGIDYMHQDLGGGFGDGFKVRGGYDFVNEDNDPMDDHNHGTHVAGIAAGSGPGLKGVAPDAYLYAYKVLDAGGFGWNTEIIAAIERSVDPNQDGNTDDKLDVVNMSLGGTATADDPMAEAVNAAVAAGVTFVIAAGNSYDYGTIGTPGTAERAITVAATDANDNTAWFSSKGPTAFDYRMKPDVAAPGVDIYSSITGNQYANYSGTSMAAPHVAGAVALLLEKNPGWTPDLLKGALMGSAVNTHNESIWHQGSGRIDVLAAMQSEFVFAPGSLSLGMSNLSESSWVTVKTLTIENVTDTTQEIALNPEGEMVGSGIEITLSESIVTIPPHSSHDVQVTFTVDVGSLPFKSYPESYTGAIVGTSATRIVKVNYSFLHSRTRKLILTGELPYVVWAIGTTPGQYYADIISPAPEVELLLPDGTYDLIGIYPDQHFVFKEGVVAPDTGVIVMDKYDAIHHLLFDPKDRNSNSLPYTFPGTLACAVVSGPERNFGIMSFYATELYVSNLSAYGVDYKIVRNDDADPTGYYDIAMTTGIGVTGSATLTNSPTDFTNLLIENPSIPLASPQNATFFMRLVGGISTFTEPLPVSNPLNVHVARHGELLAEGVLARLEDPSGGSTWETSLWDARDDNSLRFVRFWGGESHIFENTTEFTYKLGETLPRPNGSLITDSQSLYFYSFPEIGFINHGLGERLIDRIQYEVLSGETVIHSDSILNEGAFEWFNYALYPLSVPQSANRLKLHFDKSAFEGANSVVDVDYKFGDADGAMFFVSEYSMEVNGQSSITVAPGADVRIKTTIYPCSECHDWGSETIDTVRMFYRPTGVTEWLELLVTKPQMHDFEASLDTILAAGYYDLKLYVTDIHGRSLTHEVKPGFKAIDGSMITLVSPPNGATEVTLNPLLKWASEDPSTGSFVVQVSDSASFENIVFETTTSEEQVLVELQPERTYYWHVRVADDTVNWSQTFSFRTTTPTVYLTSPAPFATDVDVPVTFTWTDVPAADDYQLVVSGDSSFTSAIIERILADTTYATDTLEYLSTYYWKVSARFGSIHVSSDVQQFTTAERRVKLLFPSNHSTGQPLTVTFGWTIKDPDSFVFQLATDSTFHSLSVEQYVSQDYTVVSELAAGETYFWRVRDAADSSTWSHVFTFSTIAPAVHLIAPENLATHVSTSPLFTWHATPGYTYFDFYLAKDSMFTDMVSHEIVYDTAIMGDTLERGTTYFWKVAAHYDSSTFWSDLWLFTTVQDPAQLVYPWNGATDQPVALTLTWSAPGYYEFMVQLSTDPSFTNIVSENFAYGESLYVTDLQYGTTYYWRVRPAASDQWSEAFSFTTTDTRPALIYPADGEINVPVSTTFIWSAYPHADYYEITVGTDSLFNNQFWDYAWDTTYQAYGLDYATKYYWKVAAVVNGGKVYSEVRTFTTENAAPVTLVYPYNMSDNISPNTWVEWYGQSYGGYYVQIATDSAFDSLAVDLYSPTNYTFVNGLSPGTTYFWRVRMESDPASWSEIWHFTVTSHRVVLKSPLRGEEDVALPITFSWTGVPDTWYYAVYVATDSLFRENLTSYLTSDTIVTVVNLDLQRKYYWKVAAYPYHAYGNIESETSFFTTGSERGQVKVQLVSPANHAVDQPLNVPLTWQKFPGTTYYYVYVSTDSAFSWYDMQVVSDTVTSFILQPSTIYYWRVLTDIQGAEPSDVFTFTTAGGAPVTLLSPSNHATDVPQSLWLEWTAPVYGGFYVQVATDSLFDSLIVDTPSWYPYYFVSGLSPHTTYFWRVRTENEVNNWSAFFQFTTGSSTIVLKTPTDNATNVRPPVTFSWSGVSGASYYDLYLATDSLFTEGFSYYSTSDTTLVVESLSPATHYFWKVFAHGSGGYAESETRSFFTKDHKVLLVSPENHATDQSLTVPLTWTYDGVDSYVVHLSPDSSFSYYAWQYTTDTVATFWLQPGVTYYWRVFATDAWEPSETYSFTTLTPAVVLKSPAQHATDVEQPITFTWGATPETYYYNLLVSRDSSFMSEVVVDLLVSDTVATVGELPSGTYFWKVVAYVNGTPVSSDTRLFTTIFRYVQLVSPQNYSGDQPLDLTLTWVAEGDTAFIVQVSTDPYFSSYSEQVVSGYSASFSLSAATSYFWRVIPDRSGADPSEVFTFSTIAPQVVLISPVDHASDVKPPVTFTWATVPYATEYRLYVSTDGDFHSNNVNVVVNDTLYTVEQLAPATCYHWKVEANVRGLIVQSETRMLTTWSPSVELIAPANNATGVETPVTFTWEAVPGSDDYTLYVSEDASFSESLAFIVTEPTKTVDVKKNGAYYWKVGVRFGGVSFSSATRNFTTKSKKIKLLSPADKLANQTLTTTFTWASDGENSFVLQVSAEESFSTLAVVRNVTGTTETVRGLTPGKKYYWRVRPHPGDFAAWSDVYSFETLMPAVILIQPVEQEVKAKVNATFSWEPVSDVVDYTLTVSEHGDFSTLSFSTRASAESSTVTGLSQGKTYYWKVGANFGETTVWSQPAVLVTDNIAGVDDGEVKGFTAHPNPSKGLVNFRITTTAPSKGIVRIVNGLGFTVYAEDLGIVNGEKNVQWNAVDANGNELPNGLYIAILKTDAYSVPVKVLLQR